MLKLSGAQRTAVGFQLPPFSMAGFQILASRNTKILVATERLQTAQNNPISEGMSLRQPFSSHLVEDDASRDYESSSLDHHKNYIIMYDLVECNE
jgi:hypothetical protein